jgi:RNA polymerase sigma-70 factor (ECF subfamily)
MADTPHAAPLEEAHRPPAPSLEHLALDGRRDAWHTLIARHQRRVVVSLLARGIPLDHAQDIANEAWMRLIEQQREGRLDALELPGLAVKQALFLALEQGRRERARRAAPLEEGAGDVYDPAADPERRALSREALGRAYAALVGCAHHARETFALVYGGAGLTHAAAAARLGLSEQRVRQILCELRKKMRAAIEDTHED